MNPILNCCPVCHQELTVSELQCQHCETQIRGQFETCKFCRLDRELLDFIEIFLVSEGNFKQVERVLNCSYPKVKNYLKRIAEAFGYKGTAKTMSEDNIEKKKEVLDQLESGAISVEEALKQLNK